MKVVVIGNFGVGNVGDDALLESVKVLFQRINKEYDVVPMGKGELLPFGIRSFISSLIRPKLWKAPLKLLKSADIVVLGPGGLFTDEERRLTGAFWALHGIVASLWYKKPLYVLGISLGRMGLISKLLSRYLFRRAKLISVRDAESKVHIKRWGTTSILSYDLTGLLKIYPPSEKKTELEKYVVLSFRNSKTVEEKTYKKVVQCCDHIHSKYGFNIVLLPFQSGVSNDIEILNTIYSHIKIKNKIIVHSEKLEQNDIIKILQGAELVLAMRLHAGILAARAGVRFISLSYMDKSSAYWSQFVGVPTIDLRKTETGDLIQLIDSVLIDTNCYKPVSNSIDHKMQKGCEDLFLTMMSILNQPES